jgi:ketosteroid isomerase-like protein
LYEHLTTIRGINMATKSNLWMILFSLIILSCTVEQDNSMIDRYKNEIRETENSFSILVKQKGLKTAFTTYAADDAVLKRGKDLIKGKKAIEAYYSTYKYPDAIIEWKPDFVEVSESGDLAYTYGMYNFEAHDDSGKVIKDTGVFHTIWKKQSDGKWLYVWD